MNARQFFDKVVEMRAKQKEFFATREPQALFESKTLEVEIDTEIERVLDILYRQKRCDG